MGIAKIEHIGAGGIEERGVERIDALAPADQGRLPATGEHCKRRQRGLERLIAAAGQRHGEEIHQRALGLMGHLRRQVVPPRVDDKLGQNLGNARIVQHAPDPRKIPASIGWPGQKCNGRGQLTAILMAAIRRYNLTRSWQPRGGFK